ncbi:MAG: hypothetical protein HY782_08720 [Chloroflexi bacterium]|nr:hypothetical protein [Chloroflexota bacterium]
MLPKLADYEHIVYGLAESFPFIRRSTLVVIRHGPAFAEVTGEIEFDNDVVLSVWEDLNFERRVIQGYSYSVRRADARSYWYDPQPHPGDPALASTFPHHKHVPPDIKHHRVPAPGISFDQPNLPFLIAEIEREFLNPPPATAPL